MQEIYGDELTDALHLEAVTFASEVWVSNAAGRYERIPLPMEAQIAPIMDTLIADIDDDGESDLICVGNLYGAEVETVRYDAGRGCVLLGNGDGSFRALPARRSGLAVRGNAKSIARLEAPGGTPWIVAAVSNGPLQVFELGERLED